jgi:hypothetical protein
MVYNVKNTLQGAGDMKKYIEAVLHQDVEGR